jgi:hypothetical protein
MRQKAPKPVPVAPVSAALPGNMTVALKKDLNKPTVYYSMMIIALKSIYLQAAKRGGRINSLL